MIFSAYLDVMGLFSQTGDSELHPELYRYKVVAENCNECKVILSGASWVEIHACELHTSLLRDAPAGQRFPVHIEQTPKFHGESFLP